MRKHFLREPDLGAGWCGMGCLLMALSTGGMFAQIVPTELLYHHPEHEDLEFIELENLGDQPVDLSSARFTSGIDFTFGSLEILPKERLVLAKDRVVFERFYRVDEGSLFGGYEGRFSNKGEEITLVDVGGETIFSWSYADSGDWPERADGVGSSLLLIGDFDRLSDPESWLASRTYGGNPGFPGDEIPYDIVVNEVLTHTDPPYQDAIELRNLAEQAVDLGGWFLSDNATDWARFRIPDNTVIEPQGYQVFYEQAFRFENDRVAFSLGSAMGDSALLTAADETGRPHYFVDQVDFGSSANGIPFGRYPDGVGPLTTLARQTLGTDLLPTDSPNRVTQFIQGRGAPNSEPLVGPVVFSRIYFDPAAGKTEFVELTNRTPFEFPLFDALAPTNRFRLAGGISFEFPLNTRIPPQGTVVVTGELPDSFALDYPEMSPDLIFGPFTGNLNNGGERLVLLRPDFPLEPPDPDAGFVPFIIVEEITYDDESPWPSNGAEGELVRISIEAYGNVASNWRSGKDAGAEDRLDSDGDGMWDAWEIQFQLDPFAAGDAPLDGDRDGVTNLGEFLSGTDPGDSDSFFHVTSIESAESDNQVTITIQRQAGIEYELIEQTRSVSEVLDEVIERIEAQDSASPYEFLVPVERGASRWYFVRAQRRP